MNKNHSPNEKTIYTSQAQQYERLISREDYQHNIPRLLERITSFEGLEVVDLGAGTGRLARLLAARARRIYALDLSPQMLAVAGDKLRESGGENCHLVVADHRHLPFSDGLADVVISGWSVCYLVTWSGEAWQRELDRALGEIRRILHPGGKIILLETLGTGYETPTPPEPLLKYYSYLEGLGFARAWARTDYRFASLAEAEELTRFFFGEELRRQVTEKKWKVLPECTGVWWWENAPIADPKS